MFLANCIFNIFRTFLFDLQSNSESQICENKHTHTHTHKHAQLENSKITPKQQKKLSHKYEIFILESIAKKYVYLGVSAERVESQS